MPIRNLRRRARFRSIFDQLAVQVHRSRFKVKISFLLCIAILACGHSALCKCTSANEGDHTEWGHTLVMQKGGSTSALRGVVASQNGAVMAGALVEVFDHAGIVERDRGQDRIGQKRLAACITGTDGTFSFNLPSGYYELRSSKSGFNCTSVLIHVRKNWFTRKHSLEVRLLVGD